MECAGYGGGYLPPLRIVRGEQRSVGMWTLNCQTVMEPTPSPHMGAYIASNRDTLRYS